MEYCTVCVRTVGDRDAHWAKMMQEITGGSVVPRSARSDVGALMQEARAIELVTSDADVPIERVQDYWALSADLIALVIDIEEFQRAHPDATYEDPTMFALKYRLRRITSRLSELVAD